MSGDNDSMLVFIINLNERQIDLCSFNYNCLINLSEMFIAWKR
jgi:hypothetical protein